ncbi:hypothetical protein VKT23_008886 [Stygiomarasmius scandens]|uniref:L-tryptophan decarboxylase PsiD-like domain-containing protein n=1 Tax=Marasmiellus scandens TaxID=2682957 RepID=A0ABR1JFU7_9AGAR
MVNGRPPRDDQALDVWFSGKLEKIEECEITSGFCWHPVIQEFRDLIESDAELYMGFHEMFEQVPRKPPYDKDPSGRLQIRDYMKMLSLFNCVLHEAPEFETHEFVAFPINAVLNWPMGTSAGQAVFTNSKVNAQFKKMFDVWSSFLASKESRYVLTTDEKGWFGPEANKALPGFDDMFICEPNAPYKGFKSWDDFFVRKFRPGVRPFLGDNSSVNCACESTVYAIAHNVKGRDQFWLKHQPYSLYHMLDNDKFAPRFIGGTVFQAYLSALEYHRWNSPVDGKVLKTVMVPGAYYAASPSMGFSSKDPDPAAQNRSQGFITQVATRALIFIEADNPDIGLMCFMAVGMAEVSTCEITVREGSILRKGDELGMFHFGGSTHCLIFRPETKVTFVNCPIGTKVKLGTVIATVGR